jgi:hypothetical protein
VVPAGFWDNLNMGQLSFFSKSELAAMRDRSRSQRYSPASEQFRREHARHRDWGLARRHAEKLRRVRGGMPSAPAADEHREDAAPGPLPVPPLETAAEQAGEREPDADRAVARQAPDDRRVGFVRQHRFTSAPLRRTACAAMCWPTGCWKLHPRSHHFRRSKCPVRNHYPNAHPWALRPSLGTDRRAISRRWVRTTTFGDCPAGGGVA